MPRKKQSPIAAKQKPKTKVSKVVTPKADKPKTKTEKVFETQVFCIPKKAFYLMLIGGFLIGFGISNTLRRY